MPLLKWAALCVALAAPALLDAQNAPGPNVPGAGTKDARGVQVNMPRGTRMLIRLTTPLSTSGQRAGDRFRARLVNDLRLDGAVLAPAGSPIVGELTRVSGGHVGGTQRLQATLIQLSYRGDLVDIVTDTIKIESVREEPARNAGTGTLLGVQFDRNAQNVVALLDDDRQLTIPSGSRAEVRLLRPLTVWK